MIRVIRVYIHSAASWLNARNKIVHHARSVKYTMQFYYEASFNYSWLHTEVPKAFGNHNLLIYYNIFTGLTLHLLEYWRWLHMWLVHAESNIHILDERKPLFKTKSQVCTILTISFLQRIIFFLFEVCCFSPLKLQLFGLREHSSKVCLLWT